ncbi:enoyl-CoA hydratase, partial [Mycobacterium sp. ITM-2017-0098]
MTGTGDFVLVGHPRPAVALVTLNRPERMNSMAFDVMVPLKAALDDINHDNDIR